MVGEEGKVRGGRTRHAALLGGVVLVVGGAGTGGLGTAPTAAGPIAAADRGVYRPLPFPAVGMQLLLLVSQHLREELVRKLKSTNHWVHSRSRPLGN